MNAELLPFPRYYDDWSHCSQACMFGANSANSSILLTWNGCPDGELRLRIECHKEAQSHDLCSGMIHTLCNILKHFFSPHHACATLGLIACPGRPHVCIRPEESCLTAPGPWMCSSANHTVCGLQRDGSGKLVIGSDGSPVPNCILSTDANADACGQLGLKPLPANLTGGSGSSQGWPAVEMSGILPNGSPAGVIANIGSDGYSGGPAYFVGNGSDTTEVVKVFRCSCKKLYGF